MNPWLKLRTVLKKCESSHRPIWVRFSSSNGIEDAKPDASAKKMEDFFFDHKVQTILRRITGLDYQKIFRPVQRKLSRPKYKFVTDKKLKELQDAAQRKAFAKLQMPPVMEVRKTTGEVLSEDPELQGYLGNKIVFTDISAGVSNRDRMVTVRELDGTLRTGNWDERFRMNQIFFPLPGRNLYVPKMFESPYIDQLLEKESYVFLLDCACVQFEPDDPYYHEVTKVTYEHVCERKKYDDLRSTRHFGPMAFYFAWKNSIESLLLDMIEKQWIADASATIQLLYYLHSDLKTSLRVEDTSDIEIIKDFIEHNSSSQKGTLELTWESYLEKAQSPKEEMPLGEASLSA